MTLDSPPGIRPLPRHPRRRKILWGCAATLVTALALLLALPWILYRVAHARLEQAAGPLRLARFNLPRMPPDSPGPRLLAASGRLRLSDPESGFLARTARAGLPGARAERSRLPALFAANREALDQIYALDAGPSSLNIDYAQPDVQTPKLFPELCLARMVYLEGLLDLEDRNAAGVARAVQSLGRQAALLEEEPDSFIQLMGLHIEKLQLEFLVRWAGDPAASSDAGLSALLLSNDLRQRYRVTIAQLATTFDLEVRDMLDKQGSDLDKEHPDERVSNAAGNYDGWWVGTALQASALDRYRLFLGAYDQEYAWMSRELDKDPKKMGLWEKSGRVGGITDSYLPAMYRATAASRILLNTCVEVRAARLACEAVPAGHAGLRATRKPDGSCLLETVDGREYIKLFTEGKPNPIPQECTASFSSSQ